MEYMLCSTALRLALAQGLHHEPSPALNMQDAEKQSRARLFWAIYCYEKHVATRAGRPSVGVCPKHLVLFTENYVGRRR